MTMNNGVASLEAELGFLQTEIDRLDAEQAEDEQHDKIDLLRDKKANITARLNVLRAY